MYSTYNLYTHSTYWPPNCPNGFEWIIYCWHFNICSLVHTMLSRAWSQVQFLSRWIYVLWCYHDFSKHWTVDL